MIIEPQHKISKNVVCATSKCWDQPAHRRNLIRAFASRLNIFWVLSYWPQTFAVSKLNRRLHRLVWVYTRQNATLLEITCPGLNEVASLFMQIRYVWVFSWLVIRTCSLLKSKCLLSSCNIGSYTICVIQGFLLPFDIPKGKCQHSQIKARTLKPALNGHSKIVKIKLLWQMVA